MARVPLGGSAACWGRRLGGAQPPGSLPPFPLLHPRFGGEHAGFSFARERGSQCPTLGPVNLSSPVMVRMELWLEWNVGGSGEWPPALAEVPLGKERMVVSVPGSDLSVQGEGRKAHPGRLRSPSARLCTPSRAAAAAGLPLGLSGEQLVLPPSGPGTPQTLHVIGDPRELEWLHVILTVFYWVRD